MHLKPALKAISTALITLPCGALAAAQLDQVVVTASQTEQPLHQVTADVEVITGEELEANHIGTVLEALNRLPGISFSQRGPLGTAASLYVRGSGNNRTLILIDGVRVNDPASTTGANIADLMVNQIERIEVIKGAQSGVWGSDAAAGVINIITKTSTDTDLTLEYGSYGTGKAALATGFNIRDAHISINAQHLESNGFSAQAPVGENIDQYEKDGYRNLNLNAKAIIPIHQDQTLTVGHNHTASLANYDGWGAPDAQKRAKNETNLTHLKHRFGQTQVLAEQSLFRSEQLDEGTPDIVTGETLSLQLTHRIDTLLIGAGYSENQAETDKFSWVAGQNVFKQERVQSRALFANHSHHWNRLTFNEALRWEDYNTFGHHVTGKFGAKYNWADNHTLALNYGTAYNAPSIIQLLNPWGTENLELTPEESAETSLTYRYNGLRMTYFDKRVEDLIEWQGGQYQNLGGITKISGLEAEYTRHFKKVELSLNYAHLETEDANGDPLERRPENQTGFDLNWFATSNLDFNLNGQYIGARSGNEHTVTEYYSVWNLAANYQANKNTRVYLKIDNVTNAYYQTVEGYATAELSAYLGTNVRF